jgi:hypothetical protein
MRAIIIVICFSSFLFKSCHLPEKESESTNNFIKEIQLLNDSIYKHIQTGRTANILRLMASNVAKAVREDMYKWVKEIQPYFQNGKYTVLENFYLLNDKVGLVKTVSSVATDERKFSYQYKVISKEMYISLLTPDDYVSQPVLILFYTKVSGKWKLSALQAGQYAYLGMTAAHFYKRAKAAFSRNNLLNASNNLYLLSKCIQPGGESWKYLQHDEMINFYKMVIDSANKAYSFPMTIDANVSNAYIYSIGADAYNQGLIPIVYYHSDINLKDTIRLRKEYEQLRKPAMQKLSDLYKENRAVIYRAYNHLQDSANAEFKYFGFVDVIDQSENKN